MVSLNQTMCRPMVYLALKNIHETQMSLMEVKNLGRPRFIQIPP